MSDKRKDHKKRILRTGESQRKDLIYQYRYTDNRGKRQTIYHADLHALRESGGKYYVEKTKTESGRRFIPITDDVYRSLKNILATIAAHLLIRMPSHSSFDPCGCDIRRPHKIGARPHARIQN